MHPLPIRVRVQSLTDTGGKLYATLSMDSKSEGHEATDSDGRRVGFAGQVLAWGQGKAMAMEALPFICVVVDEKDRDLYKPGRVFSLNLAEV